MKASLLDFSEWVLSHPWRGREREAISLYVFGFLQKACRQGGILRDPTQIGIEVALPQLPGPRRKKNVCKDLVIWTEPAMTCWDASGKAINRPIAIMEWKRGPGDTAEGDISWLCEYCKYASPFVGYSVVLDVDGLHPRGLRCARIAGGAVERECLVR
ncbi:MAG TPA: hypothetical protein PKK06_17215 [Phycisphaerae bacterium]|nr:hypothetical protein [Phycisphaerae bacterium]